MKISSIKIENFKSITNIEVPNLPDFVVIVGENGIGKTSIFDAISFLKSIVGPYHNNDRSWWQNRIREQNPIRTGANSLRIEIEIEPTTNEEKKVTSKTAKAGVSINAAGSVSVIDEKNASSLLSSWRKIDGIGAIEIIPANRTFSEGQIQLQSLQINEEQLLHERTTQIQNKYHHAKNDFVNCFVHDKLRENDPQLFPEIKGLVETLLGKKVQINPDERLVPRIEFESSSGGWVNIDTLSAGQRELFMTYVGIHSIKLSNSVILFDEPDLHLHASLQKEVLKYLMNLAASGNQVFLATHSLEMIAETPEKNLFHLSEYSGSSQLANLENEKDKLEIFRKLGASKYTFVNFKKVVFLEGPSDYLIIKQAGTAKYKLRFEQIGGISKLTPEILDKATDVQSFYLIRDRDFLSDSEIISLENKYKKKIRFLKRRHIENYILDSDELFEIYQKHGNGKLSNKSDMQTELYKISEQQFEQTIADYYLYKHTENTNPPQVILQTGETSEKGIQRVFSTKEKRLRESIDKIDSETSPIRSELKGNWKNDWLIYCSGKNVLKVFVKLSFSNKTSEDIIDLVSTKWDEKKQLPSDIDLTLKEISA